MQAILTQSIVIVVLVTFAMLITDFVCSVRQTPQVNLIVESSVVATASSPERVNYAALDWVKSVDDIEVEMIDVVEIARSRMPNLNITSLNIRELKKLASDRKIRNYGKMNKAELVLALQ